MSKIRFNAVAKASKRKPIKAKVTNEKLSSVYAEDVFSLEKMQEYLSKETYSAMSTCIKKGKTPEKEVIEQVANAMKEWAISKKATHYTHWFQPLTGSTAEKHDAFFRPIGQSKGIEVFEANNLTQQEPDASSFPNGGIRNTFEARGYTAWDPSSPAFIMDKQLCIPTIFISYNGDALDYKSPLLRTLSAVNKAATQVAQLFNKNVSKVTANLGWEQEYFLVDEALYNARPDIVLTGRTLLGHSPSKGQQLNDHYFGSIPSRVTEFIKDFELKALKLGIPVITRHNEVAPNQFECAPIFEDVNLANDHNLLIVNLIEKTAQEHHFKALLHEKPYSSVNGSGKHNNWSLSTDTGINLLNPGKNPKSNIRFLTFLVNTIKAIYDNADILRASIASAGNDHRLGANEAPPAIISVFLGESLTNLLNNLEKSIKTTTMTPDNKTKLKLSINSLPELNKDNTDRNRTSPFAFTGNKFEYRAPGSSVNCATIMTALNAIVANQLNCFKKEIDTQVKKGVPKDVAILKELQHLITDSKDIRFEGNGYSEDWEKEAKKRKLSNLKNTPEALKVMKQKKVKNLFKSLNIFTEVELESRYEMELEKYILSLQIESRTLGDLAQNHVIPTAINYQNTLIENIKGLKFIYDKNFKTYASTPMKLLSQLSLHLDKMKENLDTMLIERKKANKTVSIEKKAEVYCNKVMPFFEVIKYHSDKLELLIDDEIWPLPKLRELLFIN